MNKKLDDFTKSLFDQAKVLVPKEIRVPFAERFEKGSEFVFPILLFFYFAKKNIRRTGGKEVKLQACELEILNGRKTYRLKLQDHDVWMVLTFGYSGHEGLSALSEGVLCCLNVYEDTDQLNFVMNKEKPNFLETNPIISIDGRQSEDVAPECVIMFQRGIYHADDKLQMLRLEFITELLYSLQVLRSTSKVYKVKPPIAGTELSASYEEKKIEEVKH